VLPEPVDADTCLAAAGFSGFEEADEDWDRDFDRLIAGLVRALERRFGESSVVAPPRRQSWRTRLARFGMRPQDITNPDELAPDAALMRAARDDSYLEFASVEFGRDAKLRASASASACMFAANGHPIIWVWLDEDVALAWSEIIEETRGSQPCSELDIAWESLLPETPRLAIELPRARLHRGDSASWTDGTRGLGFHAGLGVRPPEVYLPPETAWETASPVWAATLRDTIIRDFEQLGVRVVEIANASVRDGHPEAVTHKPPA
jgi:hypothetical protein